jgi:hypothetical protein
MSPELGQTTVDEPGVPAIALAGKGEDVTVATATQFLDCPVRVLEVWPNTASEASWSYGSASLLSR